LWLNGDRYSGDWNNGQVDGRGTFIVQSEGKFDGHFTNGNADKGIFSPLDNKNAIDEKMQKRLGEFK